jgi:hypothetical protein
MIYKNYVIETREASSSVWIARISRIDGKNLWVNGGWQNSFFDTMGVASATEAERYAKAAIDSREVR